MTDRWAEVEEEQVGTPESPDHENPSGEPSPGRIERFLIRHRRTAAGRLTGRHPRCVVSIMRDRWSRTMAVRKVKYRKPPWVCRSG